MALLLDIAVEERARRLGLLAGISVVAVGLVAFLASQPATRPGAEALQALLEARTGVELRDQAFAVLSRDGADNLDIMARRWQQPRSVLEGLNSFAVTLPAFLAMTLASRRILRSAGAPRWQVRLATLAAGSPFVVHALAWDMHRFNALAQTTAFLMLWTAWRARPARIEIPWLSPTSFVFVALLLYNAVSQVPLFDAYQTGHLPFFDDQLRWLDILRGRAPFPVLPEH